MSSGPFFNTKPVSTKPMTSMPTYDKDEHWTRKLDRRPVGSKYGKGYGPKLFAEDRDTLIDNWEADNEPQNNQ